MPNLPILSNQQLSNSGDNMKTGIAQWINTILMIFGVIGGGAFYLAKMDSKIDNIISFAVYIPDLDKSSNKKERVHACENPTKQRLLKAFPKLGRFKNVFGS